MNKLYKDTFEHVKPTEEQSERIREQIRKASAAQQNKKTAARRRFSRGKAVAAALVAVMLLSTTVFGEEVKDLFQGFLKKEKAAAEYVEENVFEASDGHVKLQVIELLSDEVTVQMTVKYEALDETGEKWLYSGDLEEWEQDKLYFIPDFKGNTVDYGTNLSAGYVEIEDYRTPTTRYFYCTCTNSNWSPALDTFIFTYQLSDGTYTASLDVTCNVPVYEYVLQAVGGEELSPYYEPNYIRLSKLSYVVYGKSHDVFLNSVSENGYVYRSELLLSDEVLMREMVDSVALIKEDGSSLALGQRHAAMNDLAQEMKDNEFGYDCLVVSDAFMNVWEQLCLGEDSSEIINPEDISGIRLSNENHTVEYEFVK